MWFFSNSRVGSDEGGSLLSVKSVVPGPITFVVVAIEFVFLRIYS
jgi:hypothetical protein